MPDHLPDESKTTLSLTRREFLRIPFTTLFAMPLSKILPVADDLGIGRVTVSAIRVFNEPSFHARAIGGFNRDDLIPLIERVKADEGPVYNPLWYRIPHGYAHSGNIQIVRWQPQIPHFTLPESGAVFEVSVPYTRTYRQPDPCSTPVYRLYYQSIAWVKTIVNGSDGRFWYGLLDDVLGMQYYAQAEHLRLIPPDELTPLSPDVPWSEKHIEVELASQTLRAYEYDQVVLETKVSSGMPDRQIETRGIPTNTPSGRFYITRKMPLRHMGEGRLTSDLEAYELPGVPWVSTFYLTGVAIHGTYWHADFGRPRSHGCVNASTEAAHWLYRWTLPSVPLGEMIRLGHGTTVIVS